MAFDVNYFGRLSGSKSKLIATQYAYKSTTDALATIVASAYFNDVADLFEIGDTITIQASDEVGAIRAVSAVSPDVTLALLV